MDLRRKKNVNIHHETIQGPKSWFQGLGEKAVRACPDRYHKLVISFRRFLKGKLLHRQGRRSCLYRLCSNRQGRLRRVAR